jgi:hypothetical protein
VRIEWTRAFRVPIEAWIRAGTDRRWRIGVEGVPPADPERASAFSWLHIAWTREMERQRAAGHPELATGAYIARLVREDGKDWWEWGRRAVATRLAVGDETLDLPFPVEDGGELPDYWREDHEAAEAEIVAGLGTFFEDDDAFDRALDEAAAHPGAR